MHLLDDIHRILAMTPAARRALFVVPPEVMEEARAASRRQTTSFGRFATTAAIERRVHQMWADLVDRMGLTHGIRLPMLCVLAAGRTRTSILDATEVDNDERSILLDIAGFGALDSHEHRIVPLFDAVEHLIQLHAVEKTSLTLTPIGRATLSIVGRNLVRWILALETEQYVGLTDRFHVSRQSLDFLLKHGGVDLYEDSSDTRMSPETNLLVPDISDRLCALGLLEESSETDLRLTQAGRESIEHVLADPPPPVVLMARAMLADVHPGSFHAASTETQQAASWARLLGHELRHTLGPLRELLDDVQQDGIPSHLARRHARALAAVDRLAELGRSTQAMAGVGESPASRFRLGGALEEAWSATRAERNGHLTLEVVGEDAWLIGPKDRLVLALVNVIRNAKAAAVAVGRALRIRATTETNATSVTLRLEDDGPGVPPELAARVFERGVSGTGGTGEGLALAREILERELRGTISLAPSRLGGAAFVLELPAEVQG